MGKFNRFLLSILLIFSIVLAGTFVYENLYDIRYEETINSHLDGTMYDIESIYFYRRYDRWTDEIKIVTNGVWGNEWRTAVFEAIAPDYAE